MRISCCFESGEPVDDLGIRVWVSFFFSFAVVVIPDGTSEGKEKKTYHHSLH